MASEDAGLRSTEVVPNEDALARIRTGMPCGAAPSRQCVYQFHHQGRTGKLEPRALMMLHGEVRRAAEITQHFLELAQHPIGAAEPSDASIVLNGVLADREGTLKELGVKLVRSIPHDMPMVACPMAQLTEMLMKLLDFSLRRLRDSQPPRELRIGVTEGGPSLVISLWDSG